MVELIVDTPIYYDYAQMNEIMMVMLAIGLRAGVSTTATTATAVADFASHVSEFLAK